MIASYTFAVAYGEPAKPRVYKVTHFGVSEDI